MYLLYDLEEPSVSRMQNKMVLAQSNPGAAARGKVLAETEGADRAENCLQNVCGSRLP